MGRIAKISGLLGAVLVPFSLLCFILLIGSCTYVGVAEMFK